MIRLLRAWGVAFFVWLVGAAITAGIAPTPRPGASIDGLSQLLRVHLPWIILSLVMALAAGALYRERDGAVRRAVAILGMPLLATVIGAVAGFSGATTLAAAGLYLIEGVFGAALGLLVANSFGEREQAVSYW
jgi:hypothetical protein